MSQTTTTPPELRLPRRTPRRTLAACLAALALAVGFLAFSAAPSQAVACPIGAWPYHQGMTGGCAHGTWSKGVDRLDRPYFKLSGTVGDDKADGNCARVEVHTRIQWAADSTQSYRVCGKGETTNFSFSDVDTASGLTGSVQAWSVRLCVGGSCSPYVDFRP